MDEAAQKNFDRIINALLPQALEKIGKAGTFSPFGGVINKEGEYEDLCLDGGDQVDPKNVVQVFQKAFEDGVKNKGYRAFGICAHLHATLPGQTEKQDLIVTSMEDESGVAVDSYLPYEKNQEGVVTHGQLASELVVPTVFSVSKPKWIC
jgi:hypothetical protein